MPISAVTAAAARRAGLPADVAPPQLALWQMACLRAQLSYARRHSSYYRTLLAGLDLAVLQSPADLARLPFMAAGLFRDRPEDLLCVSGSAVERITTLKSSSSSGIAKRVFFTEADLRRTVDFFAEGMRALVAAGERTLILLSDATPNSIADLLQRALARLGVEAIIQGPQPLLAPVQEKARGVDCIVGMPAQLNRLCLTTPELHPKSVLLTADYLPEAVAERIRATWGSATFSHYGLTEVGFGLAVDCPAHQGHHARDGEFILEIVDPESGSPLPPGAYGELVVTSLLNEAMPVVRYRTGDLLCLLPGSCACGSRLPRLGKVLGRVANRREQTNIHALDEALFRLPGLLDYRVSEEVVGVLKLTLDALAPLTQADIRAALQEQGIFVADLEINYEPLPLYGGALKRRVE